MVRGTTGLVVTRGYKHVGKAFVQDIWYLHVALKKKNWSFSRISFFLCEKIRGKSKVLAIKHFCTLAFF